MNSIRSLVRLLVVTLVLAATGTAGAWAQGLSSVKFSGTFTLPFEARWGGLTLPAGDYSLYYGEPVAGSEARAVEIVGQGKGRSRGMVLASFTDRDSKGKNAILCLRTGKTGVVRGLDLPAIGKTLSFRLPRGEELMAQEPGRPTAPQTAQAARLTERIPVQPADQ